MYTDRSGPVELNQTLDDDQSEPNSLRFVSALRTVHLSGHAHHRDNHRAPQREQAQCLDHLPLKRHTNTGDTEDNRKDAGIAIL